MRYSDQTNGESLSRGHYQTVPRDFKPLNLPPDPHAKRKENILWGLAVLIFIKRATMDFIDVRSYKNHAYLKQRYKL